MATLSVANFKILTDSMAWAYQALITAMGLDGSEVDTTSESGKLNRNRVLALDDYEQESDLLAAFQVVYEQLEADVSGPNHFQNAIRALNNHLGNINTFAVANAARVAPQLKSIYEAVIGVALSAEATFSPVVDPMGAFLASGAGAGTFTPGTDIDNTNYYASNLVLYVSVPAGTGANLGTYTVSCTKWDGTSEDKAVAVAGLSAQGTEFDIGIHGTDMYIGVTNIILVGGQNLDEVKVKSELERVIAK